VIDGGKNVGYVLVGGCTTRKIKTGKVQLSFSSPLHPAMKKKEKTTAGEQPLC
jgi:hypothetical protein